MGQLTVECNKEQLLGIEADLIDAGTWTEITHGGMYNNCLAKTTIKYEEDDEAVVVGIVKFRVRDFGESTDNMRKMTLGEAEKRIEELFGDKLQIVTVHFPNSLVAMHNLDERKFSILAIKGDREANGYKCIEWDNYGRAWGYRLCDGIRQDVVWTEGELYPQYTEPMSRCRAEAYDLQ